MPMLELLVKLREFDALRDTPGAIRSDRLQTRFLPGRAPEYAPPGHMNKLPSALRETLVAQGVKALYAHQAEAIERILSGVDVVLEAPTASGKTLCFNLPLLKMLIAQPRAHALMVHPMKALSNDQRRQFQMLAEPCREAAGREIDSWIFDGDLDQEQRRLIKRQPPAVLFTNPEMLHASFLGWRDQWSRFLANLRLVIIDEIHEYRGHFGTNVALLMRRFFAYLSQLGVRPQIILSTATCGNAEEHAYRLTGRRCELVRASAAMKPARHFAFIDPDIPDHQFHDIYRLRIARAALACMATGLSTLVFCPSRRFAEEVTMRAQNDAEKLGIDKERIAPYRSGYEASLRRQIEDGLRSGRYDTVFSTNALEIGVDIGRLDACILAGFPDSVLSAWQRIGRVGRSWDRPAHVLFYAFNNPFDRFFARNIDAFLDKPLDQILIGVDNEELMGKHVPYLANECGHDLPTGLAEQLGTPFFGFACKTLEGKKPVRGPGPNYQRLNIRGGSGATFRLMHKGGEIGTISDVHLFREAFVGAIYSHFGQSYRVAAHAADEVLLVDVESYLRTEGVFYTVTSGAEILTGLRYEENLAACYGKLTIFENFSGYREVDTRSGEVVNEVRRQLARPSNVRGFWLELGDPSVLKSPSNVRDMIGLEQLLRIGAPFVVPCDRHDLGTLTNPKSFETVYLYETVPGGIGVAEKALGMWQIVVEKAIEITKKCPCRHGCPSCIVPPRKSPGLDEPRKDSALVIADQILRISRSLRRERFDQEVHAWVPIA